MLKRLSGGMGLDSWIQPSCSCGWKGRKEYAHNDYQYTNVREQEDSHRCTAHGTHKLTGETALLLKHGDNCLAQFDRLDHPESHGWFPYKWEDFDVD